MQNTIDHNNFYLIRPQGKIGNYIKVIWYSNLQQDNTIVANYLPKLSIFCALVLNGKASINFGDHSFDSPTFTINGLMRNKNAQLQFSPYFESIGMEFTAAGAAAFFNAPPSTFENNTFSMEDVVGVDTDYLVEHINNITYVPNKLHFFLRYMKNKLNIKGGDELFIDFVQHKINTSKGSIRVNELANHCHLTEKTFKRRFENLIGTTPKNYIKLVRFHSALDLLKSSNASLEEISYQTGYFDTSHMVRDFRSITSFTPIKLISSRSHLINSIWGE